MYDLQFVDGLDKYGPIGYAPPIGILSIGGDWNNLTIGPTIVAALSPPNQTALGTAWSFNGSNFGGSTTLTVLKDLPANFARAVGGFYFTTNSSGQAAAGVEFRDTEANAQASIAINAGGTVSMKSGNMGGGVLATSTLTLLPLSTYYCSYDITIGSAGAYQVWVNGISMVSGTGNTRAGSTNNYFNVIGIGTYWGNGTLAFVIDHFHMRMFTASGSADTPIQTAPIVELQFPIGDVQTQLAATSVLGNAYSVTANTNAPGAGVLALQKVTTPVGGGTINSVSLMPAATSATAKFQPVFYANTGSAPSGAPLSGGAEVVGCVSGTLLTLPLTTPQGVSANTTYWVGFITDTSVILTEVDTTTTTAFKATNTYASGPPTSPTMTSGQPNWQIFGNLTGQTADYSTVSRNPTNLDMNYVSGNVLGLQDKYSWPALSIVPSTIHTVALKASLRKADPGVRKVDLLMQSGTAESSGSANGFTAQLNYGAAGTYFDLDPNTGGPLSVTTLNASTGGPKIAS